jgi:glucose-1-phosphate thymidylyltransferase
MGVEQVTAQAKMLAKTDYGRYLQMLIGEKK